MIVSIIRLEVGATFFMDSKENYRRNLPHRQPKDGIFNICFRLDGTLPLETWKNLKDAYDFRIQELEKFILDKKTINQKIKKERDLYFGKFDNLLDNETLGPTFLKNKQIALIVTKAIHYYHRQGKYELICYCIMPNHVHLIIHKIKKPLFRILQSIKTFTAREANLVLSRTGKAFWQKESFDNLVHDEDDLKLKINYVLNNPIKAKFVNKWKDWDFTYLNPKFEKLIT